MHYTDDTLKRMLGRAGFRVVETLVDPPVQTPNWHEYVGHYYQYPTPWLLDWKRKLIRSGFYWFSWLERLLRMGSVGYCAPNIAVVAIKASPV